MVSEVELVNIELVVQSHKDAHFDRHERETTAMAKDHKFTFLDTEKYTVNNKTLTAGTQFQVYLDSFVGKAPYLVLNIKDTTDPTGADRYRYNELGADGTVTLANSGGQDLLSNGTSMKEDVLYDNFVTDTGNANLRGFYVIPFNRNVTKSVAGSINSFYKFHGQKDQLLVTPSAAATAEVHTITLGTTGTAGGIRPVVDGYMGEDDLDYNDTAAVFSAAYATLKPIVERGYTPTVNQNLDGNASYTVTFDQKDLRVSDELGAVSALSNLNTGGVTCTSAVTTYGSKFGWVSGSAYTVEILFFKFRELTVSRTGGLSVRDL